MIDPTFVMSLVMSQFASKDDLIAALRAEIERLRAQKTELEEALREYACTASDHPCGCYDQFLSEKAEIERLRALVVKAASWLEDEGAISAGAQIRRMV